MTVPSLGNEKSTTLPEKVLRVLPAALIGVLAMHFAMTMAYLTPLNPVKLRLMPVVEGYIRPFFEQRWTLFAPNVDALTRYVLVSCRGEDAQGVVQEQPWVNITLPLHELKQRYRLTPADRLDRAQTVGISQLTPDDDEVTKKLLSKPADTEQYRQAVAHVERQREHTKRLGSRVLGRVASSACASLYPSLRMQQVRVRMATIKAPSFSQRMESEATGDTNYTELPWQPYEEVKDP
ncbi:DUF5819 family protein [Archangium violaceum]|uniref:DUF5819 family protein n=1 Tax=Archangium violaceum TaxID=83451 RepID=UPI0036DB3315